MAGLLGQIFSAGNVAKRQLRDLLGNPVLAAQQMAGNLNDRARNLNEMTSAAAQEGMDYGPASQRLAGLMADAYNPIGLTVFHGSPAKFNKFDRTKIGSGEGAQAYGYGHYVAEKPDVAKGYQTTVTRDLVAPAQRALEKANGNIDAAIQKSSKEAQRLQSLDVTAETGLAKRNQLLATELSKIEELNRYKQSGEWSSGNLYEIDLPDEQIAKMLDYDKPLKQQSQEIKDFVQSDGRPLLEMFQRLQANPTTKGAYRSIMDMPGSLLLESLGKGGVGEERLLKAGIPGIRYFDEGSRSNFQVQNTVKGNPYGDPVSFMTEQQAKDYVKEQMEKGFGTEMLPRTQNFVVFPGNEDLLTILKRNGGLLEPQPKNFETSVTDASQIFGEGAKRIKYTDPNSGGMIDVLQRPDGTASVLGLEVPEAMRGQGIGQSLQSQVMQDFPEMMGQVSSRAAAKTAYRLGRRPPNQPDATLDDVYKIMDEYSSVNLVSPEMQKRFMQSLLD